MNQPLQGDAPTVDQPPTEQNTTERDEQSSETNDEAPKQWWIDPAVISAISSGVSAIFAVLIWLVYRGQWRTMAEQARYMRDGLAETRKAADAAAQAARTADKELRLVHQQWLTTSRWSVSFQNGGIAALQIRFDVVNPTAMGLTLTGNQSQFVGHFERPCGSEQCCRQAAAGAAPIG